MRFRWCGSGESPVSAYWRRLPRHGRGIGVWDTGAGRRTVRRKIQLGEGQTEHVACASASVFRGLDTVTGEVLGAEVLAGRVG